MRLSSSGAYVRTHRQIVEWSTWIPSSSIILTIRGQEEGKNTYSLSRTILTH